MKLAERYPHPELYEAYPQLKNYRVEFVDANKIGGSRGQFDPEQKKISIDRSLSDEEAASTVVHEAQHGVQSLERGFSRGGSVEAAASRVEDATSKAVVRRALLKRMIKAEEAALKDPDMPEEQVARLRRDLEMHKQQLAEFHLSNPRVPPEVKAVWEDMPAFQQYRHLGGEAEARLAQNRQRMREPSRMGLAAKVAPYLTPEQKRKLYPWTKVGGLDVPLEYLIP